MQGRKEGERSREISAPGEGVSYGINGGSYLEASFSTCECVLVGGNTGSSVRITCFLQSERVWTL